MNDPGFIRYLAGFELSKEAFLALPATDQVTYRSAWQDERRKQEAHQAHLQYQQAQVVHPMKLEFKPLDHPASVAPLDKVSVVKGWRREVGKTTQPLLYLREPLVEQAEELDNFFTSTEKMKLYVTGAPGSGKTTFILLYAFKRVTEKNERALVVQYRQSELCEIMVFSKGSIVRLSQELSSGMLFTAVQQVLEQDTAGFDFFVFDGVRQSLDVCQNILGHLNTCFTLEHGKNGRKGIHITSLQFVIKDGDGGREQAKGMTIQSWRLPEYRGALVAKIKSTEEWSKLLDDENDRASAAMEEEDDMDVGDDDSNADLDSEALLEMLERKFYYGGGSVRFMFEYTMSELLKKLKNELLPQMNSKMWEDYAKLTISSKTASAVNTLMQVLPTEKDSGNNYFPVSKYILHKAHEMCGEALVNSVKAGAANSRNPVLRGWASELEQIELINTAMKARDLFSARETS